jgi:hypothetical protein
MALRHARPETHASCCVGGRTRQRFGARHHWSGSSQSIWAKSLSALGALEEVERTRCETVVLSDR